MSIASQAANPSSTLRRFLDTHLPTRHAISERWLPDLTAARWFAIPVDGDPSLLGLAAEMRLGLDLADRPAYWDRLAFLPADHCTELLEAAGFASPDDDSADARTEDPTLRTWNRVAHPVAMGEAERAALAAVLEAACWDELAHKYGHVWSVQKCRLLPAVQRQHLRDLGHEPEQDTSLIDALAHVWRGYQTHGRAPLHRLGRRVLLDPEIVSGFARADLVVGRTLVDIKCYAAPAEHLAHWLDQLLGYLLLDHGNSLCIDRVAVYCVWQATLLTEPVDGLLRPATRGAAPKLALLRDEFRHEMREDLDDAMQRRDRARFPIPAEAMTPPDSESKFESSAE